MKCLEIVTPKLTDNFFVVIKDEKSIKNLIKKHQNENCEVYAMEIFSYDYLKSYAEKYEMPIIYR